MNRALKPLTDWVKWKLGIEPVSISKRYLEAFAALEEGMKAGLEAGARHPIVFWETEGNKMKEEYAGPGAWFLADETEEAESGIEKDEKAMEAIRTLQELGYTPDDVFDAMWDTAQAEKKEKPDG